MHADDRVVRAGRRDLTFAASAARALNVTFRAVEPPPAVKALTVGFRVAVAS
jgi:hypothetical protein